jgi:hypothetical protein
METNRTINHGEPCAIAERIPTVCTGAMVGGWPGAFIGVPVVAIDGWSPGLALDVKVPRNAVDTFVAALTSTGGYQYADFAGDGLTVDFAAEKDWDAPQGTTATAHLSISTDSGYYFACTISRLRCCVVARSLTEPTGAPEPVMMTVFGDEGLIETGEGQPFLVPVYFSTEHENRSGAADDRVGASS